MIDFRFLRHFWYFAALAEELHFGKAAKRLGISQPPLSQQIKVLEQLLGISLFERSSKGIQLTKEGAYILPAVRNFLDHAKRLEATILQARNGVTTDLTIGAINSAIFDLLPELLEIARHRNPSLNISVREMDTAACIQAVRDGSVDISFGRFETNTPGVCVTEIIFDELVAVIPAGHTLAESERLHLSDLSSETFVLFPRRVSPAFFDSIVSACKSAGFSPNIKDEVSSVASQIAMVGCGSRVGLVPTRAMRFGTRAVVFRPLVNPISICTTAAAHATNRKNSQAQEIINLAIEVEGGRRLL